jgi:dihydroxyacid dehydratase/phosphogluconate dehydratase
MYAAMYFLCLLILMTMQSYGNLLVDQSAMRKERMSSTTHAQGAGPCGGMYTANTVASVIGTMGMSLAYRCKAFHTCANYIRDWDNGHEPCIHVQMDPS